MKLVRRKRKRESLLFLWVGEGYFIANERGEKVIWVHDPFTVMEYYPSRHGENTAMAEGLEMRPRRRYPKRRLRPKKGRPLIYLPPNWEQLLLPWPWPRRK